MGQKLIPHSFLEALQFLEKYDCQIVAGGSDIMLQKKNVAGSLPKFEKDVLFISNLDELNYERLEEDGLHIGSTKNLESILENVLTPSLLKDCLSQLASVNIRNFATLAGNVANASPAGDTIVVEVCLNAKIKLTSINGSRLIDVYDFVKGVRKIYLNKNEMIEEIIFPLNNFDHFYYHKVGSRKAESISKVSFAGALKINKNIIEDISICFGSIFIKPVRSIEVEKSIIGLSVDELNERRQYFIDKYSSLIKPITDQRSTKEYRYEVALNILNKFFDEILKERKEVFE